MPYFAAFSLSTEMVKDGVVLSSPSSTSTVPSVFSTTFATSPASSCSLSRSFPFTLIVSPLPISDVISEAEVSVVTSQSMSFVSSSNCSITSALLTSDSSSRIIYMEILSVELPPIMERALPPAMAPMVSIPSIVNAFSTTSSAISVSSSKVSVSSSFAEIVALIWFVSIFISMKEYPLENAATTLVPSKTITAINTIGLKRRHTAKIFP